MSLKATNTSNIPVRFYRYGKLQGMMKEGELLIGISTEVISGQEVWFEQDGLTDIVHGFLVGGSVNSRECHEHVNPFQAGVIPGLLYLADINGKFIDEPIIGSNA